MEFLKLTHTKLSVEEISNLVSTPSSGALSIFIGTTRNNFEGKTVINLEYEAYETMAIKSLQSICNDLRSRWKTIENIAIYHRLGTVPVMEASIVIAISSPHRQEAMLAVQWCIDNVKKSVPIWKKEIYEGQTESWKENKESSIHPPRIKFFKLKDTSEIKVPFLPPHLIQVKADNEEIERRIQKFIELKREEINQSNIRDFCSRDNNEINEFSCARVDAKLIKRKDSKGHLKVSRVLNTYHRDHGNLDFLKKYGNKNGTEERIASVETQLNLEHTTHKDTFARLQGIENRLLHLESLSPEYINFWNKNVHFQKSFNKKRIFTVEEIDSFINNLENKRAKLNLPSDEES